MGKASTRRTAARAWFMLAALTLAGCGSIPGMASDPGRREAERACDTEARRQTQGSINQSARGMVFRDAYNDCMQARGY
jgi:hypothetical protein